ncbi:putative endolysin [Shewanella phage S0112]|nr:putative endolysin [Shewanella phage S0112]
MINMYQLRDKVLIPTLKEMPKGAADNSVSIILLLIAHESRGGTYLKQIGRGPGLGMIQMEPETYQDTWEHGDSIRDNAMKMGIILSKNEVPPVSRLFWDLRFNIFMARQKLYMAPPALPQAEDLHGQGRYLKKYWNGPGKATPLDYVDAYRWWATSSQRI